MISILTHFEELKVTPFLRGYYSIRFFLLFLFLTSPLLQCTFAASYTAPSTLC